MTACVPVLLSRPSQKAPALAIFLGLVLIFTTAAAVATEYSHYGNPVIPVRVGQTTVKAEVVASPERLYLGLSHRAGLAEGQGMLFLMPSLEIQQFCMRGMRFSLDILWIVQGRVVGIAAEIPPQESRSLASPQPVNLVL